MAPTDPDTDPTSHKLRVLHVTEAFGGGVASALEAYTEHTPEISHSLAYTPAREAPAHATSLSRFDDVFELGSGHVSRIRNLRRTVKRHKPDVIHAHSTYGGFYARVAVLTTPVIYTPHCFAYLREDFSYLARSAFKLIEAGLRIRTSVFAACSVRESELAPGRLLRRPTIYVPNALPKKSMPRRGGAIRAGVTLVGIGRANHQKDPHFFAQAARHALSSGVASRALWVGDGDPEFTETLSRAGVDVLGWRSRADTRALLAEDNVIYLHSALWEGFPIAILEAHEAESPLIVRRVRSFDGVDFPLVADAPADVTEAIQSLLQSTNLEAYQRQIDAALSPNDPITQQERLRSVYQRVRPRGRTSEFTHEDA